MRKGDPIETHQNGKNGLICLYNFHIYIVFINLPMIYYMIIICKEYVKTLASGGRSAGQAGTGASWIPSGILWPQCMPLAFITMAIPL